MKHAFLQKLVALFCLGWLLFSFPLLALWDHEALVFGIPVLPGGLFLTWLVLIGVLAWLMERPDR